MGWEDEGRGERVIGCRETWKWSEMSAYNSKTKELMKFLLHIYFTGKQIA